MLGAGQLRTSRRVPFEPEAKTVGNVGDKMGLGDGKLLEGKIKAARPCKMRDKQQRGTSREIMAEEARILSATSKIEARSDVDSVPLPLEL